jgi:hypothetical protein
MEQITPGEVDRMLRQHLRRRSDLGLWNALRATIFEPQNPFSTEPRRKPHRWFVLFVVSLVAALAAFAYFNFLN